MGQRHHRHRHFLQLSRTLPPLSLLQAAQEEYDPEENLDVPAVTRLSSGSYDYDDPAAQAAPDTPPGVSKLSPRSPDASDAEDSDGEHESGRGRASERERSQSQSVQNGPVNLRYQAGAGVGVGAAAAAAASGGPAPASPAHHRPCAQPGADLAERLLAMPDSASAPVSVEAMARMIEEHNWGLL